MRKYFFKAPFRRDAYISLRFEGRKFAVTEDGRFIVAAEPLTLKEYYVAFISEVPFQAYVEDRAELVLPDDLENVAGAADEVRRNRRPRPAPHRRRNSWGEQRADSLWTPSSRRYKKPPYGIALPRTCCSPALPACLPPWTAS